MGKESQLYSKAMHEVHGRDRLKGFSNFLKHGSKDANAAYKFPLRSLKGGLSSPDGLKSDSFVHSSALGDFI